MKLSMLALFAALLAQPALAENKPASNCEVYIRKVAAGPSSHGSGGMTVVLKVNWLGGGETIERVGMYGYQKAEDLGNAPDCHMSPSFDDRQWKIYDAQAGGYYATEYGEYEMRFPTRSGSVVSRCPGYRYAHIGTFFVQTNKNTYWVNPGMDSSQYFWFDSNGERLVTEKVGTWTVGWTDRADLRYYNPLACH